MFLDLDIDEVAEDLWVGRYPSSPEFVHTLAGQVGINSIVSIQTDLDFRLLGVNWPAMEGYLKRQRIAVARVPISDFDERDLEKNMSEAVAAVHFFRATGHRVYLHCTAGLNRSPTVAVAYLVAHQRMDLDAAWSQVTTRRQCAPTRKVLERWVKRNKESFERG
jgi:protein-tyrosine phosphatase